VDRYTLLTGHLRLVPITLADCERLAAFHADARVMNLLKHGVLDRAASDRMVADYAAEWPALGFGSWTVSERATGTFVGLGGLRPYDGSHGGNRGAMMRAAFTPEAQGKGYGPELGRAAIDFAYNVARVERVVAVTRTTNAAGQRSLEKLGMKREREYDGGNGKRLILYVAAR
jgi:ribosomal-protein-alanine N-acetyltransferase